MDGYSYDADGNLLNDGVHSYTYDAESRIINVDGGSVATYVYDAEGRRVQKTTASGTVYYVYAISGEQVAEVNSGGGANREEVYAGGKHLATYVNGTIYFNHADWLGTERMRTTVSGSSCETIVNLAFGDGEATTGSCSDASPMHFTGKMHDDESNLDDFDARYYSSQWGRFISADWSAVPAPVPYANFTNPQTLNLYAIVADNPDTFADLTGHDPSGNGADPTAIPNCSGACSCNKEETPGACKEEADEKELQTAPVKETANGQQDPATDVPWSLAWQASASASFLGQEVKGAWDAIGGALLSLGSSVLSGEAEKNIATTAEWAVTSPGKIGEALKEGGDEVAQTAKSAASGDPHAIGEVVGTAAAIAYAAENVKVTSYKSGGGGLNVLNTPTEGSRIAVDVQRIKETGGSLRPHVDVTIKKPGVPSGPGSNLINIKHWPW